MNEGFMNELEGAARVIMAAPNLVTNEERRKAEDILLNFRRTKTPIRTCRQILEKSNVDYLHFEAAEVIKRGIVREWNFVSFSDKEDLIQYLFKFVVTRDIPCFVRDKILIAISIMVKRISADDNGKQRRGLLNQVEDLIRNAENPKKILGCQLVLILMQEYATTCKSSDLGLPWEVHNKCKKQFETTDLIRIFKFVMGLLKDVTGIETPFQSETANFIRCLLQIAEQVLVWSYNNLIAPKRIVGQFESTREVEDYPLLYFTMEWKDVFLAPELVPLMFMIYWKVRYTEELSHHALTCLIQLASVTAKGLEGRKIYNEEARIVYVQRYLENFSKLISSVNIDGKEALGISSIAKKLCFCYHYEIAHGLTRMEQDTFLDEMTTLTCHFCEKSVSDECNDDIYEDSFRNMISVWCYLFGDYGKDSKVDVIKEYAIRIFSKYVQSRIGPPSGFRKNATSDEEIDNENVEDSDRIKYLDQLQVIGIFGRYVLEYSLPVLYKLLEFGTEQLKSILQIMEVRPLTLDESVQLESVFEDLHWCLIIAGHVLAIDSDGETPTIPSEIMAHSVKRMHIQSNLDATLETLAKSRDLLWVNPSIDQCDDVIRLFSDALKLCVIEDSAASIKLGHFMSPLVSCSLMWFIKRFCMYYLVPTENNYTQLSPILVATLGKGTEGANYIVNFILSKVQNNIVNFYTEPVLLQDTVDLFGDIVSVKNKSQHFMNADNIWSLITMQNDLKAGHLPPEIRRGLYRGFALAGVTFCHDRTLMTQYMEKIFHPIQVRFNALLVNGKLLAVHNEHVQNELVDVMECLIGASKGAAMRSAHDIFNNMCQIVETMVGSFKTYYNYQVVVQSVLELLSQSAKSLVCYLKHEQAYKMFRYSVEFVTQYAQCHANRLTSESSAEDFISQDLSYILDVLTYLLSKDYLDFCPSENAAETIKASTYVMRGFCVIMPFLSQELLKYPNLCLQYYRLLTHINDMCPREICTLDNEVMVPILRSVEVGLSQFSPEITQTCLDFIARVSGYMYKHKLDHTRIYDMLRPCLKLLLDLAISNQISADLLGTAGEAVYLLVCCYPKEYEACVQMLVQGQQDPMVSDRLSAAFDRMLAGIDFDNERSSRIKFKTNFEKFVFHVQGFLLVK